MLIRDVMVRNPVTVSQDLNVLEAKRLLEENKISSLPVLDKNDELVGVLTRNDLLKVFPSQATTLDVYEIADLLTKIPVKDVMSKSVKTGSETLAVEEAARLMSDYDIGCLPIMEKNVLVGIVTINNLFRCFTDMFNTKTPGVRAVIIVDEKPGVLARISTEIASLGGNIVSIVTSAASISSRRKVTIKSTVTVDQFNKIAADCGAEIEDIRNV